MQIPKNRATFREIESLVGLSRYRPFYIWASSYSHSSMEVFKKITVENKIMLDRIKEVRPELEDFIDPMQITLAVLQDVASSFLNLVSHENETAINTELLLRLYEQLIGFFKIHTTED